MELSAFETPCLILDQARLDRNIALMRDRLGRLGVPLRPHGKTAKSMEVVRRALAGQPGGLAVSTLKEAEYFRGHGVGDLLYAVGIAPIKLPHVAALLAGGARITIVLDSLEQARAATSKGEELGVSFPVLIEIDSDGHRAGLRADDRVVIEIAEMLAANTGAELGGVMTHAGGSYGCSSVESIREMAAQERDAAVTAARLLRAAGHPCEVVSVGSTPTATLAEDLSGVTEVRAGVYMFQDLVMAGLGVCDLGDIALSVLASVIGHHRGRNWLLTDAGWTALSRDRGTASQKVDHGYGLVCDLAGAAHSELIVTATNQEHGIVSSRDGTPVDFDAYPIGSMVRILPNHACATGVMHDRYHVVADDTQVRDVWSRCNGW